MKGIQNWAYPSLWMRWPLIWQVLPCAAAVIGLTLAKSAMAAEFAKASDCVVGIRVLNRDNQAGVIVSADGSSCRVKLDATGKIDYNIFWMLRPEGASSNAKLGTASKAKGEDKPEPQNGALTAGIYKCYMLAGTTLNYAFIDIHIVSGNRYRDNHGKDGTYVLDGNQTIRFTGPLSAANAKLLSGNRIGLNMTGGNFYNTTCSIAR